MLGDVDAVAAKLVALKAAFPAANAFKIVSALPRILLKRTDVVQAEAAEVRGGGEGVGEGR